MIGGDLTQAPRPLNASGFHWFCSKRRAAKPVNDRGEPGRFSEAPHE